MMGLNKAPIFDCITCGYLRVTAKIQPTNLGKGRILAVVIQNTLNNEDGTGNNTDIMVGKGTGQIWQMTPGQESPLIYASDLEEIFIRVRSLNNVAIAGAAASANVTVLVYRLKGEGDL